MFVCIHSSSVSMRGLINPQTPDIKKPISDGIHSETYQHVEPSPNPLYDVANVQQSSTASNPVYFKRLGLKEGVAEEEYYDSLQRETVVRKPLNPSANASSEYANLGGTVGSEYSRLGDAPLKPGKVKLYPLS